MESVAESVTARHPCERPVRVAHDGIAWSVEPASKPVVAGLDAPHWLHLECEATAELIKSNPLRRVWRVRLADRDLFVKEFFAPSAVNRLRSVFRGGPALREWRAGKSMESRGVACIHFVAIGSSGRRRFLISDAAPGASLLSDAWSASKTADERRRIVAAVAQLVASAHTAGIVHGDDHPRNILITPNHDAVYADLCTVRTSRRITIAQAVNALAQLNQWFRLNASQEERLRFLFAYCRATSVTLRSVLPKVQYASRQRAYGLWAKRDRRILRENRYFATRTLPDGARACLAMPGRRAGSFPPARAPAISVQQWDRTLNEASHTLRSKGPGRWNRVIAEGVEAVFFVFRRFGKHRPSTARRLFRDIHRLRNRDLPVPWAYACVERRGITMLCTDGRGTGVPIGQLFRESSDDIALRRRLCRAMARTVARLADQGAAVAMRGGDTFAYDCDADAWVVPNASHITLSNCDISVRRLRRITARAIYESLSSRSVFRKTDGVLFLKCLHRRRWKSEWRRVQNYRITMQDSGTA